MSQSSKVVILGARGMLGVHVAEAVRTSGAGRVVEHSVPRFMDGEDLRAYLLRQAPTTVINCMGYTGTEAAEHFRVNACFPRVVADCCCSLGALFIHISSNAVFAADEERSWLPSDRPGPVTPYEVSKALGEDSRAYVIRTSFIGRDPRGEGLFERLRRGLPYADRRWNGVTADTLARHISTLVADSDGQLRSGIEHVHSPQGISFREIAGLMDSTSSLTEYRRDARLLGGGKAFPDIRDQLAAYVKTTLATESERELRSR